MAGRVASPRSSTATSVGPWPSTPIATTSAASGDVQPANRADDRRPPGARILLGPAVRRPRHRSVAGPRQARAAGRRAATRPALTSVVPRSRPRNARGRRGHRRRAAGTASSADSVEGDDGLGRRHVGHQRPNDAGPQRTQDGPDLALACGHGDGGRDAAEPAGIEGDHPIAQGRADEPAIDVEWRDEDLADGVRGLELALDRVADHRRAPGRSADPEQRDVEPVPEVGDRPDPGVRDQGRRVAASSTRPGAMSPRTCAAEGITDPAVRLALLAGGPEPAAQRDDGRGDRAWRRPRGRRPWPRRRPRRRCRRSRRGRTAVRRTSAARRPTIRRVRSSGPATVGARWTASRPNR